MKMIDRYISRQLFVNLLFAIAVLSFVLVLGNVFRKLLGDAAATRLAPYSGSGAYDRMLEELVAERIDGALMDKPYAL